MSARSETGAGSTGRHAAGLFAAVAINRDGNGNALAGGPSAWRAGPVDIDPIAGILTAVSCASPTFCVAVDTNGRALTWNGSSWAAPSWSARSPVDPDGGGLTGVSCFPGACVAVDFAGNAVVFPCRPNGGRPTGWASHVLSQQGAMEFAPSGC